jgi:hypothetical protein
MINEDIINESLRLRKEVRNNAKKNKKYGFDLPLKLFFKVLYCYITPQSYGTRVQNRFINDYELKSVPSSKDKGDVITKNNKNGELKCSFRDVSDEFHFVQIRPFQNCDFYLFTAIDTEDDYKKYDFCILKKDINKALTKLKATNCHGVEENKIDISRQELRFSVKINSKNWDYLVKNFLVDNIKETINNI